jgi:hypothetical protein
MIYDCGFGLLYLNVNNLEQFFLAVLGIEPRALHMLDKHSTT